MLDLPRHIEAMTEDEYRDFVDEMYWSVREGAMLYELPLGVTDVLPDGDVVHGPWLPEDCSRVLSAWHGQGLLGLYRHNEDGSNGSDVDDVETAAILGDPTRWVRPGGWADVVALSATERGESLPADGWRSGVDRTAR